jgi:hypothetical protein
VCTQVEVCSSNQAYFESPKELGMQINQFLDQNRKKNTPSSAPGESGGLQWL